jgi:hypothetical protein
MRQDRRVNRGRKGIMGVGVDVNKVFFYSFMVPTIDYLLYASLELQNEFVQHC